MVFNPRSFVDGAAAWHSLVSFFFPESVKDYIQKVKAHMSLTCPAIEEGVSLTSHYVDVQVSQRETFRSGKTANRVLDKELIITGDTDRQNSLLGHSQVRGSLLSESSQMRGHHLVTCFYVAEKNI